MRSVGPAEARPNRAFGPRSEALFLDFRGLPDAVAQVVELRSAHVAAGDDLDLGQGRRVDREGPLDPDAEAHLADREGLAGAAALAAYHRALKHLHALAVALDDADVHLQRVARGELGDVVAQLGAVDEIGAVHDRAPGSSKRRRMILPVGVAVRELRQR